ncbi:MAG: hypothetical protein ABIC04_00365 [Nanoarchaeota archaeon]
MKNMIAICIIVGMFVAPPLTFGADIVFLKETKDAIITSVKIDSQPSDWHIEKKRWSASKVAEIYSIKRYAELNNLERFTRLESYEAVSATHTLCILTEAGQKIYPLNYELNEKDGAMIFSLIKAGHGKSGKKKFKIPEKLYARFWINTEGNTLMKRVAEIYLSAEFVKQTTGVYVTGEIKVVNGDLTKDSMTASVHGMPPGRPKITEMKQTEAGWWVTGEAEVPKTFWQMIFGR